MKFFEKWLDNIYSTYLIELPRSSWSRWRNQQSKNTIMLGEGRWIEEEPDPRVERFKRMLNFGDQLRFDVRDPLWYERMSADHITPLQVMRWKRSHWK